MGYVGMSNPLYLLHTNEWVMIMKTVVVYNYKDDGVRFYLVNEDVSRFHGIEVNSTASNENYEAELATYDFGKPINTEEVKKAIIDGANLISCAYFMGGE